MERHHRRCYRQDRLNNGSQTLGEAIAAGWQTTLAGSVCKDPDECSLEKELNYLASRGLLPKLINGPCEVVQ